ncbi:MAG TPA: hypothetical protein VKU89_07270 [Solirubrobacteraceae bacterium]|nr:hypothetical protein [Solirubrobacteraceae bacterium]
MPIKKTLIAFAGAALISLPVCSSGLAAAHPTPAGSGSATPGNSEAHRGHGEAQHANHSRGGRSQGSSGAQGNGHSQRCKARTVAYVVSGTLVSESLLATGTSGLYSGEVTLEVKHVNRFAREAKGKTETYKVADVRLTLGLRSASGGPASVTEVKAGDRVKLIGRTTFMPRRCTQEGFAPTVTVKHIVIHDATS